MPVELLTYRQAVERAFQRIAQNEVISSWKDAFNSSMVNPDLMKHMKLPAHGVYQVCYINKFCFEKK